MKYISILIVVFLIAISCNKTGRQLKERIANTDSIAINFFKGDGTMDTVVDVKIVRDKKTIAQITDFVTASSRGKINSCGYDGSMHFFKMNRVVQDIDFSLTKTGECNQFTFLLQGKYVGTAVTNDAAALLMEIKKK